MIKWKVMNDTWLVVRWGSVNLHNIEDETNTKTCFFFLTYMNVYNNNIGRVGFDT